MAESLMFVPKEFRTGKLHVMGPFTGDHNWHIYNSPFLDYQHDFRSVLGGARIEDLLRGKPDTVVVDLMAPTGTLADLFTHIAGDKKLGIAVSLEDIRDQGSKERDTRLGIFQIAGDIAKPKTWKKIEKLLQGRKVDLIMERAVAGLEILPKHPGFYGIALQRMWSMLNPEGTMLIQLPSSTDLSRMGISIRAWLKALNDSKIVVVTDSMDHLFIQRSASSPEHLPFPHDVLQKGISVEPQVVDGYPIKSVPVYLNEQKLLMGYLKLLNKENFKPILKEALISPSNDS